jgi:2-C-methyl-D-erythritol 4-phosphate cytidylyltransferase
MIKYAIIVAGGSGTRMGTSLPKQFLPLGDKPVLYYTIHAFLQAFEDLKVILVLPFQFVETGKEVIDAYFDHSRIQVCVGGETRFHSVQNGLAAVQEESIIFVHDAVRCMVTRNLIHRCYEAAMEKGTAIPVVPAKDSVRMLNDEGDSQSIEREKILLVQTPQTFHSGILIPAYQIDHKEKFTDEASVVEAFGLKLHLVEGDPTNIKITTPSDMIVCEAYLQSTHN